MTKNVAVIGCAIRGIAVDRGCSLEEVIFEVAQEAVLDAGIAFSSVDSVVLNATDQVDGRIISAMVTAGAAGAVGRDMMMIASASEHAFAFAHLQLLAGHATRILVMSWGKPSESIAPEHAELISAEPFVLRPIGMNDTVAAALQASRLVNAHEGVSGGPIAVQDMVAWPLRRSELPGDADIVAAVVLAEEASLPVTANSPVWVRGLGWAMDRYEMGDRNIEDLSPMRLAWNAAKAQAGMSHVDAGVVEVHAPSTVAIDAILRLLDIRPDDRDGERPGSITDSAVGWTKAAAGLASIVRAVRRLNGPNADLPRGPLATAVAASTHGFASQGATVTILSIDKE